MSGHARRLYDAARNGDLVGVEAALTAGAPVDARVGGDDERGVTALIGAAASTADDAKRAAVISRLIAAGADVEARDTDELGETALSIAARNGSIACVTQLLDGGASVDAVDSYGRTALHATASVFVATLLLERGASVTIATTADLSSLPARSTALDAALYRGSDAIAALISAHGGRRNLSNRTASLCASIAAHAHADARRLMTDSAMLEERDDRGRTPLLIAIDCVELELARELVAVGANPHVRDAFGQSGLHVARRAPLVELLLSAGVDPNMRDDKGRTALHARASDPQIAKRLLEAGASVNVADAEGLTPIAALFTGHDLGPIAEAAALLLEAGASPHMQTLEYRPRPMTLHLVDLWMTRDSTHCRDGLAVLLRYGADPNAHDGKGWTALHEAAYRRHTAAIALLRTAGARVDVSTTGRVRTYRAGTTAADVARDRGVSLGT